MSLAISVIIPTLNEAENLVRLLPRLARETTPHETIVVDGGSSDGSLYVCNRFGVATLSCECGRGRQLRAGARLARGATLLFLHADSRFPGGGLGAIVELLAKQRELGGGNFRLVFDGRDDFSLWLTGFYARIRRLGIYYGDSGIFIRRSLYEQLGGVKPLALMEDYDLVKRMEKAVPTGQVEDPALITSSRRFHGRRPSGIVAGWLLIHLLHGVGIRSSVLASIYRSTMHAPGRRRGSTVRDRRMQ